MEHFGHIFDKEGFRAIPSKVQAILGAPNPKDVSQLHAFLGLLKYYGKLLPNIAGNIHPLNNLLRKDQHWKWCGACQRTFHWEKQALA